ncbi:sugar porter family MFS transporter [Actinoallomurus spadix]|nr:sugar porter family MFS transporter [Actinoallomurus spadix]MCO5985484.1 sugar porter family MFS transporter [Actinoallomurus spadix]
MKMTIQAPVSRQEHTLAHVVFISAAAALGGFLFGYDSAVINGAVDGIKGHFHVGAGVTGLIVSSALLGSAVGAAVAGRLADLRGRLIVMRLSALLFVISAVGSMFPFAEWELAGWRIVGGIAIGMASVVSPTYIAEIAPPAYRGRLASFQQLAIVLGIAISQLVNFGIASFAGGEVRGRLLGVEAWQWMLGVAALPALVFLVVTLVIPESPRYLVANNRLKRARQVLAEVEGEHIDLDARIEEIRGVLRSEHKPSVRDLRGPALGLLPIVWIGIALSVLQQFVGINVIFYYSASLWHSVGISQTNSLLISLSTSIINILGTLIAIMFVDRIGRKPLALIGSVGMTISLAVMAWAFSAAHKTGGTDVHIPHSHGMVALVAAHTYVLFFALSWGVVVWVMLGEIFPNRVRAAAMAVAVAAQWIANWLVTVTFPSLSEWSLSGAYIGYSVFALLSVFFVIRYLHETKGKRLEEMG